MGIGTLCLLPDSNYCSVKYRNLLIVSENEVSPKFVKYFLDGGPFDSTLVLFKRGNDIVLLSLKNNRLTEQIIFKGDSLHSYTEFSGMYYYDLWGLPRGGLYIFAIEKDLNNIKRIVSRYKGSNGWEENKSVVKIVATAVDLTIRRLHHYLLGMFQYIKIRLNGNRRLFYLRRLGDSEEAS